MSRHKKRWAARHGRRSCSRPAERPGTGEELAGRVAAGSDPRSNSERRSAPAESRPGLWPAWPAGFPTRWGRGWWLTRTLTGAENRLKNYWAHVQTGFACQGCWYTSKRARFQCISEILFTRSCKGLRLGLFNFCILDAEQLDAVRVGMLYKGYGPHHRQHGFIYLPESLDSLEDRLLDSVITCSYPRAQSFQL